MSTSKTILKAHREITESFHSGINRTLQARLNNLRALKRFVQDCEPAMCRALYEDTGRDYLQAIQLELAIMFVDLDDAIANLASWMKPRSLAVPWTFSMDQCRVISQPLGPVLVIAPWNYPILLALLPVIGALTAGNTVLLKPSEVAPASTRVLASLLPQYLSENVVRVIPGGPRETQELLSLSYGRIFFTGGPAVGKIVLRAAAETMTPTSLELGGKCPTIVGPGANVPVAAKRIIWGKLANAGQTCLAPDYVLCHPDLQEEFVESVKKALVELYGPSRKIQRVVSEKHWVRLNSLLDTTAGNIWQGGKPDKDSLYFPPTLVTGVEADDVLMQDEIFGPILPILTTPDWDSAIAFVNSCPAPLSTYVFGSSEGVRRVIDDTMSGSCIGNDVVLQMAVNNFPFGGVGASGMDMYRGHLSFKLFSHEKSVMHRFRGLDWISSFRYPPLNIRRLQYYWLFLFNSWRSQRSIAASSLTTTS
ncbi:fatty aldehyde dehydrogenase [Piptocephalis cylindrospora]|uniref:Aldehyde dehydrogenase n=1 Tax=Piptocephalis cylindrospora TaxID=1907219 RepID=A0A4P9Y667_9FUNG|nr:fatty aldehyde dehydrogenase [Piptocephalis cylindrospora]|eukprot:RKP13320.1 fatty aldehyde dehydrogenase [Piptocephalis cylindrospora]